VQRTVAGADRFQDSKRRLRVHDAQHRLLRWPAAPGHRQVLRLPGLRRRLLILGRGQASSDRSRLTRTAGSRPEETAPDVLARDLRDYLLGPGQDGGGFSGAPCLSPGPELPGPPPTLFWPGTHCLLPGPGVFPAAGAAIPSAAASAVTATSFLIAHLLVVANPCGPVESSIPVTRVAEPVGRRSKANRKTPPKRGFPLAGR